MGKEYIGYTSHLVIGDYLHQTRADCIDEIQPSSVYTLRSNISECIFDKFTEYEKTIFASRQYILTLWPAFVGAIVSASPDASLLIYDNIWWSTLFALTCGGLPGQDASDLPTHHIKASSLYEARAMVAATHSYSKFQTMGGRNRNTGYVFLEWFTMFISYGIYLAFCIFFGYSLKDSVAMSFPTPQWLAPAAWYYISCTPAILGILVEVPQNRFDLYEPTLHGASGIDRSPLMSEEVQAQPAPLYTKVEGNSISIWLRIIRHQWQRSRYRIIVRHESRHWFFVLGRSAVGIGRITVFALGSVAMGNVLFMPVPNDLFLFVLLLFVTAVPRQLWPAFWANGNRGADLVIFVKDLRLEESDEAFPGNTPHATFNVVPKSN